MIYLKKFYLRNIDSEVDYMESIKERSCYDSVFPFFFFSDQKGLSDKDRLPELSFSDITIFCGSNGSGKSTLLNVIAEKMKLKRESPYNKTVFFNPYLEECKYVLSSSDSEKKIDFTINSRIITSDDVFKHILNVRENNEKVSFKRELFFEEKRVIDNGLFGLTIDFDNSESVREYKDIRQKSKLSASEYARRNAMIDERTFSNGENGFKYFTDSIKPGGLYLLDEPENSLSAEMQILLAKFIQTMAKLHDCQFVISTHSPFILCLPVVKIYNMDATPVETCKWTKLPSMKIYNDFFNEHRAEFAK